VFESIKSSPSLRRGFFEFKYHGNALHASQLSGQSSFIGIARLSSFTPKDDIGFTLPLGGSKPRDEASGRAAIEPPMGCSRRNFKPQSGCTLRMLLRTRIPVSSYSFPSPGEGERKDIRSRLFCLLSLAVRNSRTDASQRLRYCQVLTGRQKVVWRRQWSRFVDVSPFLIKPHSDDFTWTPTFCPPIDF
jgi:hypothetical protein